MNIVEMKGIVKVYPNGVVANDSVDFSVRRGEIHALLGENGAGKSTLMKILFGVEKAQEGEIFLNGERATFHSSRDAIRKGIGMVSQHFMLVPSLSLAENIVLGDELVKKRIFLDRKKIRLEIHKLAAQYNFDLKIEATVAESSVVVKQKVEILKTLYRKASVLILDEPTAVLTPQETQELFTQLRILRDNGKTIIFITHKLDEIKEICDRLSIMNQGRFMGTYDARKLSSREIARLMIGREIEKDWSRTPHSRSSKVLAVRNVSVDARAGKQVVSGVSFELFSGEIVGVVGVEGNGQTELIDAICGLRPLAEGEAWIADTDITNATVENIRKIGIAHIPEDRMEIGIAPHLSLEENLIANTIDSRSLQKRGFIDHDATGLKADDAIDDYDVRCRDRYQMIDQLSGGNIQKAIVAREISGSPKLIVANQPTRGIDVGSAEFIRKRLLQARENGSAILLVSADLTEARQISDRIIVLYKGSIAGILQNTDSLTDLELGEYMLGIKTQAAEEWAK